MVAWVKARANCTPDDNLTEIMARIRKDVGEFNQLPAHKRGPRRFGTFFDDGEFVIKRRREVSDYQGNHVVDDPDYSGDVVSVRCAENAISVRRNSRMSFEIVPRWNAETQKCDLLIDGETFPLWQVSEKIVGNFMFEGLSDDAQL